MPSEPSPPPPAGGDSPNLPPAAAALLATYPDAALIVSDAGKILAANERAGVLAGSARAALVGRTLEALVPGAVSGADAHSGGARTLATLARTDGTRVPVELCLAPLELGGLPLLACYLREPAPRPDAERARRDAQLAGVVDRIPAAFFQKDPAGRYEIVNAACAAYYGMDAAACIGKTDQDIFPHTADVFRSTDLDVLATGLDCVCEQAAPGPGGTRHFIAYKTPVRDAHGAIVGVAGTSFEITELKRSNIELHDAESRLRSIVQGMPVLLDAFDEQGRIVVWNAECERVTGYAAAEVIGNPRAMELLYPDPAYLAAMMEEAESRRDEEYSRIYDLTAKDGTIKTIEWFNVGARLKIPGWLEWSVGIDITERRRLEAALHEATVREQRRLGLELHDGLGQELTGLSLLASSTARRHAAGDPALARDLASLAAIAARAIGTCKNIARGLAPVDAPNQGLGDALKRLAANFAGPGTEVEVEFREQLASAPQIPLEACNHLYRIAQEALTNAVRHSGAHKVRIELATDAELLTLRISDDGRGFTGADAGDGMGLRTMRYRASAIGARLSVSAGVHGGTTVTCESPNPSYTRRRA